MTEESPEQVREKHIRDMGPELGPVYHALWIEVASLHVKWNQYRQLYGHSRQRFAFLQKVAGHFFEVVGRTMYDDVLLHLTRLTDPARFREHRRLSLEALPERVPEPALASEVKELVRAAREACDAAARSSRNQRIAHTDFEHALAGTYDDLPSRAEIETALSAVCAVLHRLEAHYCNSQTGFRYVFPTGGDADSLVRYLMKGYRAEERRIERFRQGKPLPEDLEPENGV